MGGAAASKPQAGAAAGASGTAGLEEAAEEDKGKDAREVFRAALALPDDWAIEHRSQGRKVDQSKVAKPQVLPPGAPGDAAAFMSGVRIVMLALGNCRASRDALPIMSTLKEAYPAASAFVLFPEFDVTSATTMAAAVRPEHPGISFAIDIGNSVHEQTLFKPAFRPERCFPKVFVLDKDCIIQWHGTPFDTEPIGRVVALLLKTDEVPIKYSFADAREEMAAAISSELPSWVAPVPLDESEAEALGGEGPTSSDTLLAALATVRRDIANVGYDSAFPPTKQSLSRDPHVHLDMASWGSGKWKPAPDLPLFAAEHGALLPLKQGRVGDCYIVAAILAVACAQPELIREMHRVPQRYECLQGPHVVGIRAFVGGVPRAIAVDRAVVCLKDEPMFVSSGELWPLFVEKAFCKQVGSYGCLHGGMSAAVLAFLTGAPTRRYDLKPMRKCGMGVSLGEMLHDTLGPESIVTASSSCRASTVQSSLVDSHAYRLAAAAGTPCESVKVHNPWGESTFVSLNDFGEAFDSIFVSEYKVGRHRCHAQIDTIFGSTVAKVTVEEPGEYWFGHAFHVETNENVSNASRSCSVRITVLDAHEPHGPESIRAHNHGIVHQKLGLKSMTDSWAYLRIEEAPTTLLVVTHAKEHCFENDPRLGRWAALQIYGDGHIDEIEVVHPEATTPFVMALAGATGRSVFCKTCELLLGSEMGLDCFNAGRGIKKGSGKCVEMQICNMTRRQMSVVAVSLLHGTVDGHVILEARTSEFSSNRVGSTFAIVDLTRMQFVGNFDLREEDCDIASGAMLHTFVIAESSEDVAKLGDRAPPGHFVLLSPDCPPGHADEHQDEARQQDAVEGEDAGPCVN